MSKYVKTLRQTLKEMCCSPYLDDYSSIKIWKATFDIRILGLFEVPLKSLVSQGVFPHHMLPPFFSQPWLRLATLRGAHQSSHPISFLILYK